MNELLKVEYRALNVELKAEEDERGKIITGRPIVYDERTNIGPFDEIIERGALDNTDLTDVLFSVNHDLRKIPLARSRRNNASSTLRLMTDSRGMDIRAVLDVDNNVESRALYSAVERGDINGMSFIFTIGDEEWQDLETDHPTRIITRIDQIFEVSAVIFPAYDQTTINARNAETLENAKAALERARAEKPLVRGIDLELAKAKYNYLYRR